MYSDRLIGYPGNYVQYTSDVTNTDTSLVNLNMQSIGRPIPRTATPLTFLNFERIRTLTSSQFTKAIPKIVDDLNKFISTHDRRMATYWTFSARVDYHHKHIPVVISRGPGVTPECDLINFSNRDLVSHVTSVGTKDFYFILPGPYTPVKAAPTITKGKLNRIVQYLHSRNDLFTWERGENGCFARAHLINTFLIALGIPEKSISRIYILPPSNVVSSRAYHVAVMVVLGTDKYVIDPHVDSRKALSPYKWSAIQLKQLTPSITEVPPILNLTNLNLFDLQDYLSRLSRDPNFGVVINCHKNTRLVHPRPCGPTTMPMFGMVIPITEAIGANLLGSYRYEAEIGRFEAEKRKVGALKRFQVEN